MFNLLYQIGAANVISALLFSTSTLLTDPGTVVKPTSFDAVAYVTKSSKIRLAVEKSAPGLVSVRLTDHNKHVLYQARIGKKQMKAALLLDVSDLEDGNYSLEIFSDEGRLVKNVTVGTPKLEQSVRSIAMQ